MTIPVAPLLGRASTLLFDETAIRWPSIELVDALNDGLLQMSALMPLLFTERTIMALEAGVYQTLPLNKRHLHRVISNATGQTVRHADQNTLDSQEPNWYGKAQTKLVKYTIPDPINPRSFLCYPPNDGNGQLDVVFTVYPPTASAGSTIEIDSIYGNALLAFVLHRAFLKDADTADQGKADMYFESFSRYMAGSVIGNAQAKEE